jgi:hypothetical protein
MASGMSSALKLGIFTEMVSELEKGSEKPSETELRGYIDFEENLIL